MKKVDDTTAMDSLHVAGRIASVAEECPFAGHSTTVLYTAPNIMIPMQLKKRE